MIGSVMAIIFWICLRVIGYDLVSKKCVAIIKIGGKMIKYSVLVRMANPMQIPVAIRFLIVFMGDETKKKMSSSAKGRIFTEEHRKNLSLSQKGKENSNGIITLDLHTGVFFNSLKNACESLNLKYKTEHIRMKRGNNNRFILI